MKITKTIYEDYRVVSTELVCESERVYIFSKFLNMVSGIMEQMNYPVRDMQVYPDGSIEFSYTNHEEQTIVLQFDR